MSSWDRHEKNFDNNPRKSIFRWGLWVIFIIVIFSVVSSSLGWFSEGAAVVKEEFGPRAALQKYEWFKDASETINEKRNTINVYTANIADLEESYNNVPRKDWDRIDKQQYNQWRAEITGIKASYNKVVKEYNAQSSKFNWDMYNTAQIPETYDLYMSN